jgi:2,3-dihydroxybenzoate-AMP ligase
MTPEPLREGVVPWPVEYVDRYVRAGYWQGRSLAEQLWTAAAQWPEAIALVDGSVRMTYRALIQCAEGLAGRLRALGLQPEQRIVVQLPNQWEFLVLLLACLRIGVVPVLAMPAHRRHELTHLVRTAQASAIVVPRQYREFDHEQLAHQIARESDTVAYVLVTGNPVEPDSIGLTSWCRPEDGTNGTGSTDGGARRLAPDPQTVALFLLSGGTSGLPKLIGRTHDDYAYNARRCAQVCGFNSTTRYLAALPLGHNFPLACPGILGTLLTGGRVVIGRSPAPERALALIEQEGVTATAVVPAVAQRWLEYHAQHRRHDLSSLRLLQVGGSRFADHLAAQTRPVLGCQLQQVYGMAEGLINMTRPDDPDEVVFHTQGRPICPDDELRIVDEAGTPVPDGHPGILLTRGPYTPRGYYRAPEHNRRAFTPDGWYRTGDVVRRRPDGNLVVEGRDKDMILRGGENISAEEVENFAYQVAGVRLAAAVAMPDPVLGERVCLYVVADRGIQISRDDVWAVMRAAGVASYKFPDRLLQVEELPVTSVGKIDKKQLRADITARLEAEQPATTVPTGDSGE